MKNERSHKKNESTVTKREASFTGKKILYFKESTVIRSMYSMKQK